MIIGRQLASYGHKLANSAGMNLLHSTTFQHFLIGIFAVANNFPALGMFLKICRGLSHKDQERLARNATLTALIVMLVALVIGRAMLQFFGISIEAFRIAGGLLLGVSGMGMLNAKSTAEDQTFHQNSYSKVISLAIIPVAIPLTTGAGTFSTIIIFADEVGHNWLQLSMLVLAILVNTGIIYIIFHYSTKLLDVMGHLGMNVLIKIVGLFTLALGVQFILLGVSAAFPALGIN